MSKNSGIGSCAFWSAGFKGFAVLVCFTGFMLQSYEIFIEFTNGHSSIGIEYNVATRIALPQITICPAKTVKYPIDKRTATKEEFMRATYGMDELILPYEDNVTAWKFKTEVKIKEMLEVIWSGFSQSWALSYSPICFVNGPFTKGIFWEILIKHKSLGFLTVFWSLIGGIINPYFAK